MDELRRSTLHSQARSDGVAGFLLAAVVEGGFGTIVAALIMSLLPAAFSAPLLYKAFHKSKQKGFSKRSVQSVGILVGGVALAGAAVILAVFGFYTSSDIWVYRIAAALFGAAAWSFCVIGMLYAVRGLRETDPKRKRRRLRGHSYALSGCSGNLLMLALLAGGGGYYVYQITASRQPATAGGPTLEAAAIFADTAKLAAEALKDVPMLPTTGVARAAGTAGQTKGSDGGTSPTFAASAAAPDGEAVWFGTLVSASTRTFDAGTAPLDYPVFNFRLGQPGDGWIRLDPARAGQNAVVAYELPDRKLRFLVTADRPGVERAPKPEALVEQTVKRLRELVPTFAFTPNEPRSFGGVDGLLTTAAGSRGEETCAVQMWIAVHQGYVYQLFLVGSGSSPESFRGDAVLLFDQFALFDPSSTAHTPDVAVAPTTDRLRQLGGQVALNSAVWTALPDLAERFPTAEYGARFDSQTGFVVAAVRLDEPSVEPFGAAHVLLTQLGRPADRALSKASQKLTQDGLAGDEYVWSSDDAAKPRLNIARIFVGRRAAYVLLGWCDVEGSPRAEALRKAFDAVRFSPLEAAVPSEMPASARIATARFYDDLGRYFLRENLAASAEQSFRSAVKFGPTSIPYLEHLVDVLFQRRRYAEALTVLEAAGEIVGRNESLRIRRAEAFAETGRRDEALKEYAAVFREGHLDDDALRRYMTLLEASGKLDDALATMNAYRARRNSSELLALHARLLGVRGDNLAATKMLERHLAQSPADAAPALVLADLYRRMQRPLDALQTVEKLLAAGNDSAAAHYWRGLAEYDLHRTRAAKDAFTRAHQRDPADVAAKQMLDHVSGLLGETENLRVRTPIEPVPLPKALVDAAPTLPMPDEFSRAPAYYLDRVTAYAFKAGADYRRTEYHTIRVLNAEGVAALNTLAVRFDPLSEEVFVNRLEVYDDSGRPAAAGDVATYYVVDEAGVGSSARDRILQMPVPGLRAGYRVELVATVRSFVARSRFPYVQQTFGLKYPVRRQAVTIAADAAALAWSGSLGDGVRRTADGVWWQATDLRARHREPFSPEASETEPTLYVADGRTTWQDEAKRYLEEISERRTVAPNVVRAAQEMTAGLEDTEAKLLAIAAFVQREIAYQPVPFGIRSRVPQPAERTLANRFGDSKDIAFLLAQMLATVGVDTRIALVNTTQPVQTKLTTLDQFDHMVVIIPQGDGGRVIDATDKEADARLPVPLRLAGRDAFVIDDRQPRLVRLSRPSLDSYRVTVDRKIRFDDRGTALVTETVAFQDYYAAAMRGRLRDLGTEDLAPFWQSLLRESGTPVVLRKLSVEQLDDLTRPLVVKAEYDVDRALVSMGAGGEKEWIGNIPAAFEATLLSAGVVENRRQPVDFPIGLRVQSRIEVEPPAGLPLPDVKKIAAQVDGDLLTAQLAGRLDQGMLKLTFDLTRPSGRYAPTRYEDYRAALRQARAAAAPTIEFAPTAAKP
jgi:tetratricopeptide (TPR) repeat protein